MKHLVRHRATGQYLTAYGKWGDFRQAMDFPRTHDALLACQTDKIRDVVELVLMMGEVASQWDITLPLFANEAGVGIEVLPDANGQTPHENIGARPTAALLDTPLNILLFEDHADDASLFSLAVRKANLDVSLRIVSDGQEGIDYLLGKGDFADRTQYPFPDLIVLDLFLPRVSAIEFLKWCRQAEICQHLAIAVLTGSDENQTEIKEGHRQGADRIFLKPAGFHELIATARQIVAFGHAERPKRFAKLCEMCHARPATHMAPRRTIEQHQNFGPMVLCAECYSNAFATK